MTKTWETLFHLSSFMKYLLAEILPEEKVDSPSYVIQSLHELLDVTVACINKIKSEPKINNHCLNTFVSNHLTQDEELINSNHSYTKEEDEFKRNSNNYCCSDNNELENQLVLSPKPVANEETAQEERNQSKVLSEKFIKLNDEMHNGRPLGHYCRPCDQVIYSKELWEKHHSYKIHLSLNDDCENKHVACDYCDLNIFATSKDSEQLFNFHQQKHLRFDHISTENTNGIECKNTKISTCNLKKINYRSNSEKNIEQTFNNFNGKIDFEKTTIRPTFVELDKQMHSVTEKGFYCYPCDEAFDSQEKWNKHFQTTEVHVNRSDDSEYFEKCVRCQLVIFATVSIQAIYKNYHMGGHQNSKETNLKNKQVGVNHSLQNIHASLQDQNNQVHYNSQESISIVKEQSTSMYYIVKSFRHFNSNIHSSNLNECFYCRPCNASFTEKDSWAKHSVEEKHLQLMGSRKFKNWKGKCNYCSLTILGTRETVKHYMEFHTEDHKQPISYKVKLVNSGYKTQNRLVPSNITTNEEEGSYRSSTVLFLQHESKNNLSNKNRPFSDLKTELYDGRKEDGIAKNLDKTTKAKKHRIRVKKQNLNTAPTLHNDGNTSKQHMEVSGTENMCDIHEDKHKVQIDTSCASNGTISNNNRIEENLKLDLDSMVLQLVNSRTEQKQKKGTPDFGALCLVCKITTDNAFEWEDHLSCDQNHNQKISSKDGCAAVNELNIKLFGNIDIIMKHKSLVKNKIILLDD